MLRLWLLGRWHAELDGTPLPLLPTRHTRALFAYIALAQPDPVPRNKLQDTLFPHTTPERGAQHLRTTLYYLRRVLGKWLLTEGQTVALSPALGVWTDVAEFNDKTTPAATQSMLQDAITLYRGPFLENAPDEWVAREAHHLYGRYIDTLRRLVGLARAAGTPESARDAAERWVREEPWEEEAHIALIDAYRARGDRAAAEAQIVQARTLLRSEWGRPPSETFERLARAVSRLPKTTPAPITLSPPVFPPTTHLDFEHVPLVGRTRELAYLQHAWQTARAGRADCVVIEGAAGMGKTRLVEEFVARVRLRANDTVLIGRANQATQYHSYALLRSVFKGISGTTREHLQSAGEMLDDIQWSAVCHVVPELRAVLPSRPILDLPDLNVQAAEIRRNAGFRALLQAIADVGPVLIVVEDVQYADAETPALLRELTADEAYPVLVVMSRRSGSRSADRDTASVSLAPLVNSDVTQLLRAALGEHTDETVLAPLVEQCGGNPLFARELIYALIDQGQLYYDKQSKWHLVSTDIQVPTRIADFLAQRLATLSSNARKLAHLLAILGRPAHHSLLKQLLPDDESRLAAQAELLEHHVLSDTGTHLTFEHNWFRERLVAGLDSTIRKEVHRRIAAVLRDDPTSDPAERMRHHAAADEWSRARDDALAATRQALHDGHLPALKRALDVAAQTMDALDVPATDAAWWPILEMLEQYYRQSDAETAWIETVDALERLADTNGRTEWRVEVLIRRGQALREQGRPATAETTLRRAVDLAHAASLAQTEAWARVNLAPVLDDRGAIDEALTQSRRAVALAQDIDDSLLYVRAQSTLAYMEMRAGEVTSADKRLTRLLSGDQVDAQPARLPRYRRQHAVVKFAAGEYGAGLQLLREGVQDAESIGDLYGLLLCQTSLCYELTNVGAYDEGRPLAEAAIALARRLDARTQLCALLVTLARIDLHSGDPHSAWALAREGLSVADDLHLPEYIVASLGTVAAVALRLRRLDAAVTMAERARNVLTDRLRSNVNVEHIMAQVWLAVGSRHKAVDAARTAIAFVPDGLSSIFAVEVLWAAAEVLGATEGEPAARPFRERAHAHLLDFLEGLPYEMRRNVIVATPEHTAAARFVGGSRHRLVLLPLPDAPIGRPLYDDEKVPVVWQVQSPEDPGTDPARRRHQLRRLTRQAREQGAVATVEVLADILAASPRTILRDIKALRNAGAIVETRGTLR